MGQEFTRSDLYHLVWSEPLRSLSKKLGVSDVAIAKRCREAAIPLPGIGYWAKREAGKTVLQPRLPPRALGQSDNVKFGKRNYYDRGPSDDELIAMTLPPPPTFEDGMDEVMARAQATAAKARPSSLGRLHPAAAKLLEQDEVRRKEHARTGYSWYAPIFDQPNEKRRLRVLNNILNALASVACRCSTSAKDGYQIDAVIGDQRLTLSLAPKGFDRHKHYPGNLVPNNGKLILQIEWYRPEAEVSTSWTDAEGPLEKRLPEIVSGLLVAAEFGYRESLLRAHGYLVERKASAIEERKRQVEEAARQERERIEREAKKRFDALLTDVRAWRTAAEIRAYAEARMASAAQERELNEWAAWALAEAQRIDPMQRGSALPGR